MSEGSPTSYSAVGACLGETHAGRRTQRERRTTNTNAKGTPLNSKRTAHRGENPNERRTPTQRSPTLKLASSVVRSRVAEETVQLDSVRHKPAPTETRGRIPRKQNDCPVGAPNKGRRQGKRTINLKELISSFSTIFRLNKRSGVESDTKKRVTTAGTAFLGENGFSL